MMEIAKTEYLRESTNRSGPWGGGLRKIRMSISSKGEGKSGGARVVTFTVVVSVDETEINLIFLYDKAERSTIQKKDILELLRKNGFSY